MFGSCNKPIPDERPSFLFNKMLEQDSQVFIWLGDAAYVDKKIKPYVWEPSPPEVVKQKFNEAFNDPYYSEFRKYKTILGVYDDHDINMNDADRTNPNKEKARQMYLDFLEEDQSSSRRTNPHGIYESYYMGDTRVKVILLDVRFNRNMENGDTLGIAQWEWLEKELNDEKPLIFFIGSGVQILPDERVLAESFLPESKERLLKLIKKSKKQVILLSGDIHMAEFLHQPCSKDYLGYKLVEFTSSGINLPFQESGGIVNQLYSELFYGHLTNTYSKTNDRYSNLNYGKISIQWDHNLDDSIIKLELYGHESSYQSVLQKNIRLKDLYQKIPENKLIGLDNLNKECYPMSQSAKQRLVQHMAYQFLGGNTLFTIFFIFLLLNIILFNVCMVIICCQPKSNSRISVSQKENGNQQTQQSSEQKTKTISEKKND